MSGAPVPPDFAPLSAPTPPDTAQAALPSASGPVGPWDTVPPSTGNVPGPASAGGAGFAPYAAAQPGWPQVGPAGNSPAGIEARRRRRVLIVSVSAGSALVILAVAGLLAYSGTSPGILIHHPSVRTIEDCQAANGPSLTMLQALAEGPDPQAAVADIAAAAASEEKVSGSLQNSSERALLAQTIAQFKRLEADYAASDYAGGTAELQTVNSSGFIGWCADQIEGKNSGS